MSASQFDDLLGDFGDGSTVTTHKTSSHSAYYEDFDPFGSSPGAAQTSHGGGSELLLDFSADDEIKNGETSGGVDLRSESNSNQLYNMSTYSQSSNPFYDSGSANPLYDLSTSEVNAIESSNPLYEFSTQITSKPEHETPSNPLYDAYDNDDPADEAAEEVDLLSGANEEQEDDLDYGHSSQHHYGSSEHPQEEFLVHEEETADSEFEHQNLVMNGSSSQWLGDRRHEEVHQHHQHDEEDEDDNYSYPVQAVEEDEEEEETADGGRIIFTTSRTETTYSGGSGLDNSQTSEDYTSNHWDENRHHDNDDYGSQKESHDIVHFSEISTTKNKFESEPKAAPRKQIDIQKEVLSSQGGVYESEPQVYQQWQNEVQEEEGVYESQPARRDDIAREADSDKTADLPPIGTAQSMRAKFMSGKQESTTRSKREVSPPAHSAGSEYVSEPRGYTEKYEGKAESGVFESEPVHHPDVVRSGEEVKDELPERGMAKNLANRFRQISTEGTSPSHSAVRSKREITPERTSRAEHVSESRGHQSSEYDSRVDAGVFENQPQRNVDVITSDLMPEDYVPEKGFARNVAAKFREMESTVKSPPLSPSRKRDFTPPRENNRLSHEAVVVESSPEFIPDIVHSGDPQEEALPERGTARNIAQIFRQMEADNKSPSSSKPKKVVTPPHRDSGVSVGQSRQIHTDYSRQAEHGIVENQPVRRDDVVRGDEPPKYEEELPERGAAKNLVNKWRQMESEGAKLKSPGSSGHPKEFSTHKEEPRKTQPKSPRTPLSPSGHGRLDNVAVHPSDLPGQYQPQIEASVFESSPEQRSDVVREADSDLADGMPKKDTAKKMLARFQSIQAEATKKTPGPVTRKDSESSERQNFDMMENAKHNFEDENKVGRSKSMRAAIQTEKCGACEKTVYAMERLEMNKRVYHKACFRCNQCKAVLTPKTFAINNDIIFCTTHYKQLFATKGNYDEGFGRVQHKKRWSSNPNLTKDGDDDDDDKS